MRSLSGKELCFLNYRVEKKKKRVFEGGGGGNP